MPDKRALKILFDTYWSSSGWRSAGKPAWIPETPPDDLEYAIRAGVMFPRRRCPHDDAVARIHTLRSQIIPSQVGLSFVASLGSNQPARRSALGSYAVALHMPRHRHSPRNGKHCTVCGDYDTQEEHDLNVLSFERHKWGGVRHEQPAYIAFDLERFATEPSPIPTPADEALLATLLSTASSMPAGAKLADLLHAIAPVVPGNKDQRRTIIGILGFAGVLPVPGRPGFFGSFAQVGEREQTPWYKDDWPYPVRWWRGGLRVDSDAVAFWFGTLGTVAGKARGFA
jgi:hypothetical protein